MVLVDDEGYPIPSSNKKGEKKSEKMVVDDEGYPITTTKKSKAPGDPHSPSMSPRSSSDLDLSPPPEPPSWLDEAESIPVLGRAVSIIRNTPGQLWDSLQPGSMRNSIVGPSGLQGDPMDLAKYAGAATAVAATGGGALPAIAAAGLGGAGGETLKQISQLIEGSPSTPTSAGEVLQGMGEAGVETALAESLGQGVGALGSKLSPKSPLSVSLPGRRAAELSGPPPGFVLNQARRIADLNNAAADLQELAKPNALSHLSSSERGMAVVSQESAARSARKAQANKLYAPLDKTSGSIESIVGTDLKGLEDIGVAIPKEIKDKLAAARRSRTSLPEAAPGEILEIPDLTVSWKSLRELRSAVGNKMGKLESTLHPSLGTAKELYAKVSDAMGQAAEQAGLRDAWSAADSFYRNNEVQHHRLMESGKPSMGKKVQKLAPSQRFDSGPTGGDQQKIHSLLEPNAPQDLQAMHKMLIPEGDWVSPSLIKSGQAAFDQVVEQKLRSYLNAQSSGAKLDLTKMQTAISKIGDDTFQTMVSLSSPAQATRLTAMRNVGEAYSKISAPTGLETALSIKPTTLFGVPSTLLKIRPAVLTWALEHPARTEILLSGMSGPKTDFQLLETANKNIAAVSRLYDRDTNRPPSQTP